MNITNLESHHIEYLVNTVKNLIFYGGLVVFNFAFFGIYAFFFNTTLLNVFWGLAISTFISLIACFLLWRLHKSKKLNFIYSLIGDKK